MIITTEIPYAPMRVNASHQSEQCSQLLFGERARVIDENSDWYKIVMLFDNYVGWIEKKVVVEVDPKVGFPQVVHTMYKTAQPISGNINIPCGAEIYPSNTNDNIMAHAETPNKIEALTALAKSFIGTPYLWGGRTYHGIDCSGFMQVIFKAIGIALPRDSSEQVKYGRKIESIEKSQAGNIAFFKNNNDKITHVGLILENQQIIHASGWVRADNINSNGIFMHSYNELTEPAEKKYTHTLADIRSII